MISETAVNDMIRTWKRARLSSGTEALGYPRENILAKAGRGGPNRPPPLPDTEMTDPEIIQAIVDRMTYELRSVFEAYHLMLIRGERCRQMPHKARAVILGISDRTYRLRRVAAHKFIQDWLGEYLDSIAARA